MDLQFDMPWLSSAAAKVVAATVILSSVLVTLLKAATRFNKNNVLRMEKSWLRVWLE